MFDGWCKFNIVCIKALEHKIHVTFTYLHTVHLNKQFRQITQILSWIIWREKGLTIPVREIYCHVRSPWQ